MSNLNRPFEWGEFDCITFANEALGGFFDSELKGWDYTNAKGAFKCYKKWTKEGKDFLEWIDSNAERVFMLLPVDGLLVARKVPDDSVFGWSLGVTCSGQCFFVSEEEGLIGTLPEFDDIYWDVDV